MANYKESEISGTAWTRSFSVLVDNQYNQVPSISFEEEEIFVVGGEVIHRPKPKSPTKSLKEFLSDTSTQFDLLHPVTDQVIGSATYQDIYIILYSLYQKLALRRDAMPEPEPVIQQPELPPTNV